MVLVCKLGRRLSWIFGANGIFLTIRSFLALAPLLDGLPAGPQRRRGGRQCRRRRLLGGDAVSGVVRGTFGRRTSDFDFLAV